MEWIRSITAGLVIGAGAAAPGISGGSLAVATGIYERFFAALGGIRRHFADSMRFLVPLAIGGVMGAACFVFGISYLLDRWQTATEYAFFGLMVGTFPSVHRRCDKEGFRWVYALPFAGAVALTLIAFTLGGNSGDVTDFSVPLGAACGIIYGLGTVIPGVSSSLIFMSMGVYRPLLRMITTGDFASLWPVAAGAVITVALSIGLINRLFERAYGFASYTFFGLLVGSTAIILPPLPAQPVEALICIAVAATGCALSYLFTRRFEKD